MKLISAFIIVVVVLLFFVVLPFFLIAAFVAICRGQDSLFPNWKNRKELRKRREIGWKRLKILEYNRKHPPVEPKTPLQEKLDSYLELNAKYWDAILVHSPDVDTLKAERDKAYLIWKIADFNTNPHKYKYWYYTMDTRY